MKNWLLNSGLALIVAAAVFTGCCHRLSNEKAAPKNNTDSARNASNAGVPATAGETNTTGSTDTVLIHQGEIRNNSPDQHRIDSIKNEKTKRKK